MLFSGKQETNFSFSQYRNDKNYLYTVVQLKRLFLDGKREELSRGRKAQIFMIDIRSQDTIPVIVFDNRPFPQTKKINNTEASHGIFDRRNGDVDPNIRLANGHGNNQN